MIITSVILGRNSIPQIDFTDNSSGAYIVDLITNQKIKLSEHVADSVELLEKYGGKGDGGKKFHLRTWDLKGDEKMALIPAMNNLSFNPFIYRARENESREINVALMFLTIDTTTYKLLKYESEMEIIATMTNTRKNLVSCVCRYKIGDKFTLFLKETNADTKESYTIFTLKMAEGLDTDAEFTMPNTKEELYRLSKYAANRNRRPLHFFYSAEETPRYILCHESERKEFIERVASYTGKEENYFYVTTVPDDINGDNRLMLSPLCTNALKLTKGVICSSTLDLSPGVCRDLGLNYVFTLYQRRRSGEDYLKVSRSR